MHNYQTLGTRKLSARELQSGLGQSIDLGTKPGPFINILLCYVRGRYIVRAFDVGGMGHMERQVHLSYEAAQYAWRKMVYRLESEYSYFAA